jgi:valyl-tRNA synthetase
VLRSWFSRHKRCKFGDFVFTQQPFYLIKGLTVYWGGGFVIAKVGEVLIFAGMSDEISKAYQPTEVEENWFSRWTESGAFRGDEKSAKPGYSIVIPPPNVTGVLTLGHVLNNTIQDILARRARMQGKEVLWLPGTDHAGIATQTKVERQLRETEGTTRRDLGRDEFLKRVWEWKDKHGGIIINQLKKLGCSCDWERERFTMDADYSRQVQECFVHFFKSGNIYRGKRMVNWCPVSLTALSDEEVIMKPQKSKLYYMRYELVETPGEYLEIATTRPETIMGDTAVAVNPKDPRYKHLIGKTVWRPFPKMAIPIVADDHIDIEFGTGVLKVTPAHDKADFEIGLRNNLEIIDVFNPDATINAHGGPEFEGLDRFKARKKAAELLEEMGLLDRVETHENNVGYSERADVPIEPRISMQWFLKYPQLERSMAAVRDREIKFTPDRWSKTYLHWLENIQDWCISRQLWWGHRIPVWYRKEKADELQNAESLDADTAGDDLHVGFDPPADPENWVQDEDVLDTWFSSWLWPFGTMDAATQEKFYPTSDLVTGPDIIFFWVARMIMAGYEFKDARPFDNVFFTSIIRDKQGRKMSKSLGNSPDPLDIIAMYGADALRFSIMRIAPLGSDVRFIAEMAKDGSLEECPQVAEGRNLANKLWNAARYRKMQEGEPVASLEADSLTIYDLDILSKLDALGDNLDKAYESYRFGECSQLLYDFFWSEYCNWYLESVKHNFYGESENPARTVVALKVIDTVLERFLQHMHPFMPHITEQLWLDMGFAKDGELLMRTPYLQGKVLEGIDRSAGKKAAIIYETVTKVRNLKAEYNLGARKNVKFVLIPAEDWVSGELDTLRQLIGAEEILCGEEYLPSAQTPSLLTPVGKLYMPLEGLIDTEAEKERLERELAKVEIDLKKTAAKLADANFSERAPKEVVDENKRRKEELKSRQEQLKEMLANLV